MVFAGGGSRCFWQVGVYSELVAETGVVPQRIAAVSAGSAMAVVVSARRAVQGVEYFIEATRKNAKNVYLERIFTRRGPVFPHHRMYREAILSLMDATAFDELKRGPDISVLVAAIPRWLGHRSGATLAMSAYTLERRLFGPVHTTFGRRLGFEPLIGRVKDCGSPEELAELILQSSCTPPFTPFFNRDGRRIVDGGAIDPVPLFVLGDRPGRTLVMVTSLYPRQRIPEKAETTYLQPSRPIPVTKWDYANPAGIRAAFELGRDDARAFLRGQR